MEPETLTASVIVGKKARDGVEGGPEEKWSQR